MYAYRCGTSYKVKYRRSSCEMEVLEFNELGINRIIHPKYIYREATDELTDNFDSPVLWHTIGSDWVSPYRGIMARQGATSTFDKTVGGNHGTVLGGGFPTARNESAQMLVDGNEVAEGHPVSCEEVTLIVRNYVSASNKINIKTGEKSDSLLETVAYRVTPNNVEVSVRLTALEDLTIHGYVGLQMTTNMMAGQAYFNDSPHKYSPDGVRHNALSLPFRGDRIVYGNEKNLFVTYTNREDGLGDLSALGTAPVHFLSQFNKLYSHLVGDFISLSEGETVGYSGGYTFGVPIACPGIENAYWIRVGGKPFYCIDVLSTGEAVLELPPVGEGWEIVEQSEGIHCTFAEGGKGITICTKTFGTVKLKPISTQRGE